MKEKNECLALLPGTKQDWVFKVSDRTAFNKYFYYDRKSEYLRYDVIVAPEKKDISIAHSSCQNVGFA